MHGLKQTQRGIFALSGLVSDSCIDECRYVFEASVLDKAGIGHSTPTVCGKAVRIATVASYNSLNREKTLLTGFTTTSTAAREGYLPSQHHLATLTLLHCLTSHPSADRQG